MRRARIVTIEDIGEVLSSLGPTNKVVHCHGVFDLLHIGHIRHFEAAKKFGDTLVVTVTPDRFVNKGPDRPAFSEELRAEAIAALECVDFVAVNKWPTAVEAIRLLKPSFYVKGLDYKNADEDRTGGIVQEEIAVNSVGGQIAFTEEITSSSSALINRHLPTSSREVNDYLGEFTSRVPLQSVLQYLEKARSLRTLVLGETIIDEYQYCETIGKSGKEPILAARYLSSEKFAGGILAVANQVAALCDNVGLLSFLGTVDSHEDYIRQKLDRKIVPTFLYQENAPTIVKRRFVELYPFQKMFEVYVMSDGEEGSQKTEMLCAKLKEILPRYDLVIVADYGHGMLNEQVVDLLTKEARFLAVNTQTNADNRGFNTLSKYGRADYACVSENEIRLDVRSRRRDLREITLELKRKLACEYILITQGQRGSLSYGRTEEFCQTPAFTSRVVDRVGAGDAVFAITSLCVAQKAPMEIVGFIASAVGAQAVATVAHRSLIERDLLFRHIESRFK